MSWMLNVKGKGHIPAEQVQVGDLVQGFNVEKGKDVFRVVIRKNVRPFMSGYRINGHFVSPLTQVWGGGKTWMLAFKVSDALFVDGAGENVCLELKSHDGEHNYWLAGPTPLLIRG